jgi:uncharacterized membrane protein HdeD (DUF308 family)
MFVTPFEAFGQKLTRAAAERIASNWSLVLLNGLVLIVAGVLIFSIDWSIDSLATFIGALFIFEGFWVILPSGIESLGARIVTGVLSIAAGIAIFVWPAPGLVVLGIFLGAWLIVIGTLTISGSFAVRRILPEWWLLLITGLFEVPLGVIALADPGATLAALVTVGGIWAVAIGVMRIVLAFEVKHLPDEADEAFADAPAPARRRPPATDGDRVASAGI